MSTAESCVGYRSSPPFAFHFTRRNSHGGLDLYPTQDSAVLTSTSWADGLVDNPAAHPIRKGEHVRFLPFAELYW